MERLSVALEHRAAKKQFFRERTIEPGKIEADFPGLARQRALIQNSVRTAASFGNMPSHELVLLSSICALRQPKHIFEFGTYDGLTTLHFALNTPADTQIVTIDLPPEAPVRKTITDDTFYTQEIVVGSQFHGQPEQKKICQVFADTTQYDHSDLKGKVDLIFIDAGHTYELVKSDSAKALEMLAPGGIIFWHDYIYTQVGVYAALHEIAKTHQLKSIDGTSLVYHSPSLKK